MNDKFRELAERTHFTLFTSPLWGAVVERYSIDIVHEVIAVCQQHPDWTSEAIGEYLLEHFNIPRERYHNEFP